MPSPSLSAKIVSSYPLHHRTLKEKQQFKKKYVRQHRTATIHSSTWGHVCRCTFTLEKSLPGLPLAPRTVTGTSHLCTINRTDFLLSRYTSAPSWTAAQLATLSDEEKKAREGDRKADGGWEEGKTEKVIRGGRAVSILK